MVTNLILIAATGIVAYHLSDLVLKIIKKYDGFSWKNCFKNYKNYKIMKRDIYNYKYQKLHDKAFGYYLYLATNNSVELAYDLASKDMAIAAKDKRINELYNKFFIKS